MGLLVEKENMGFGVHCGYERGSDTEATPWASIAVSIFSEINKKEARDIFCASFLCEIFRPGGADTVLLKSMKKAACKGCFLFYFL